MLLHRLKNLAPLGLILITVILMGSSLSAALYLRFTRLMDTAELLPLETEAFWTVNMDKYQNSPSGFPALIEADFLGTPLAELAWFERDQAWAYLNGRELRLLEIKSRAEAEAHLESLLMEGESFTTREATIPDWVVTPAPLITCFTESLPLCFTFLEGELGSDILALSASWEALDAVQAVSTGGANAEDNPHYSNVKGRLSSYGDAFLYLNLPELKKRFTQWGSELGIPFVSLSDSLLQLYTVYGASIRMEAKAWLVESFTGVDKSVLGGEAYYHPNEKYNHEALAWGEDFAFEWGGRDLSAQIMRLREIFSQLNSTADLVFESRLEEALSAWLGNVDLDTILPLLEGEFYLGLTPGENAFLLFIELEEGDAALFSTLDGLASVRLTEHWMVIADSEDRVTAAVDRLSSGHDLRNLNVLSSLLAGSDEGMIFRVSFFPEEHILKTVWTPFTQVVLTRKRFDDGIFTRLSLQAL